MYMMRSAMMEDFHVEVFDAIWHVFGAGKLPDTHVSDGALHSQAKTFGAHESGTLSSELVAPPSRIDPGGTDFILITSSSSGVCNIVSARSWALTTQRLVGLKDFGRIILSSVENAAMEDTPHGERVDYPFLGCRQTASVWGLHMVCASRTVTDDMISRVSKHILH